MGKPGCCVNLNSSLSVTFLCEFPQRVNLFVSGLMGKDWTES